MSIPRNPFRRVPQASAAPSVWRRIRQWRASPAHLLVGGAGSVILFGTLLLMLPEAATSGHSMGFVNALFTATSAVCVTGLNVLDTPREMTSFGHVVLLLLMQAGGLGYMTAATFVAVVLGRRMGLRNRLLLKEAMASPTMEGLLRFATLTVKVTLVTEGVVAVVLALRFMVDMPAGRALWFGVFHAVSAFNNAGFALFSDSLMQYRDDPYVLVPTGVAVVVGGLGYLVLADLSQWLRGEVHRLTVHTRLTLIITVGLGLFGALALFGMEMNSPVFAATTKSHLFGEALFQSWSSRTAGLATMDMAQLMPPSVFLLILLMLIGGGSGSCAGGIKVTTIGVILASLWATLRGREQAVVFHRTLSASTVQKSFFLGTAALFLTIIATWMALIMEHGKLMPVMFEVASAVGTVGLSFGDGAGRSLCAGFGPGGKLLITLCMFLGRLGPLTIGIAVLTSEYQQRYRLPTERVLIG
ncbi:MAG: Trk family potassium uptake protein [Nitrospirota bacterium]|nr:Trk family potassium uptake protein [Nitrospirota bacterium]